MQTDRLREVQLQSIIFLTILVVNISDKVATYISRIVYVCISVYIRQSCSIYFCYCVCLYFCVYQTKLQHMFLYFWDKVATCVSDRNFLYSSAPGSGTLHSPIYIVFELQSKICKTLRLVFCLFFWRSILIFEIRVGNISMNIVIFETENT